MKLRAKAILVILSGIFLWGCTTTHTVDMAYSPSKAQPVAPATVKLAVIPFEDATWNGLENPYWVGQASLYGLKLNIPTTISQLVTRSVKKEMEAYGYQLSTDEIYSIQIGKNDVKTLLRKIPHIQVDFLVGGTISHFFVQQVGRFIADVEIEAYLIRPPHGDIAWSKKIGHREVRVPFTPDTFPGQTQDVLNNLMDKTLKDLFRNSDFRVYTLGDKK
jgi:hypothetical protein